MWILDGGLLLSGQTAYTEIQDSLIEVSTLKALRSPPLIMLEKRLE
jgi:hypothetical protein